MEWLKLSIFWSLLLSFFHWESCYEYPISFLFLKSFLVTFSFWNATIWICQCERKKINTSKKETALTCKKQQHNDTCTHLIFPNTYSTPYFIFMIKSLCIKKTTKDSYSSNKTHLSFFCKKKKRFIYFKWGLVLLHIVFWLPNSIILGKKCCGIYKELRYQGLKLILFQK